MICPRCGKENSSDAIRCPFCGYEFSEKGGSSSGSGANLPQRSRLGRILSAFSHAIFYVILFVICQSMVVSGYLTSLMASDLSALTDPAALAGLLEKVGEKTVLILLISNLLTILLVCALMHLRRRRPLDEIELYPVNPFRFGSFALFGAAMNTFVSVTMSYLPLPEEWLAEHESQTMSLYGDTPILLQLLSVAVVAGITEEIVFRGLVISRLKKGMGSAAAVVLSAVFFGFAHGSTLAVVYASLLGLLLGGLYARYQSILPGMIFHVFFNMTSYFLPADGTVLLVLYFCSVAVVVFEVWRIFIRYPQFTDTFTDVRQSIKPVNEEEAAIIAEVRQHQRRGMITADQLQSLQDRWNKNRKEWKKNRKK